MRLRHTSLAIVLALTVLAADAQAQQNLVKNGGFEGSKLAPWIVISGKNVVSVADKIAVGSGVDRALRITGNASLTQSIFIPEDGYYQVSFSARRSHYSEHAQLRFGSNTQAWAQLQTGSWCPSGHLVEGGRPIRLTKGWYPLWLSTRNARDLYVDEVVLRKVSFPLLWFSDTTYGRSFARSFVVQHDRANNVIVPILSSHRFSTAAKIPSFAGDFWLDPTRGFWFAIGALISTRGTQKAMQLPLRLPRGINAGLFMQTLDISGRIVGPRFYVQLRG